MSGPPLPGAVHVLPDPGAVADAVARWLADLSMGTGPVFRVAVSGGSTPRLLYRRLASTPYREDLDWTRWHLFFGDERAVPPDDTASNYRMVREALLDQVPLPPAQVHRMQAERQDLDAAAADYAGVLELEAGSRPPRLDVVLLGVGGDGHTASLFPGTAALDVDDAWATRGLAPQEPRHRLTLTLPTINAAAAVAFLVTGEGKRDALRGVVEGTGPAARVRPAHGSLHWFLDAAAAQGLR